MTKQEFLAFSLPYGLKIQAQFGKSANAMNGKVTIISPITFDLHCSNKESKPILHPLSSLTKTIEHVGGEKFVPMVKIAEMRSSFIHESEFDRFFGKLKMDIITQRLPFDMMLKLIEYHFDIANLIESGEAIDVNTLEINPYK